MTNQLTKTMKNYRLHFTQLFEEVRNIEANDAAEAKARVAAKVSNSFWHFILMEEK